MSASKKRLLEPSPYAADGGQLIGRDPRTIPADEWLDCGYDVGLRAIRSKCLDCGHTASEVRKCATTKCSLWALRMGVVPKGLREVRKQCGSSSEEGQ